MRAVALLFLVCALGTAAASTQPRATLKPFTSEREFDELLAHWRSQARSSPDRRRELGSLVLNAMPAAPQSMAKAVADSSGAAAGSITNVQHAGVDEGGIVKRTATTWSSCGAGGCSP